MNEKQRFVGHVTMIAVLSLLAGGVAIWLGGSVAAGEDDGVIRAPRLHEVLEGLRENLTDEQREAIAQVRERTAEKRAERRMFVNEQRALLADLDVTPEQWDALAAVVEEHRQPLVDASMALAEARNTLRSATLDPESAEETIRAAAAEVGVRLGEVALAAQVLVDGCRKTLTPEQQAALGQLLENAASRREGMRFEGLNRVLQLRGELDMSGMQKAAIADAVGESLRQISVEFGPGL